MQTFRQIPIEKLRELYIDKQMTLREIGKLLHVDHANLGERMKNEGISLRTRSESQRIRRQTTEKHGLTKEKLYDLYVNKLMPQHEIASLFNVHQVTIFNYMQKWGIPARELKRKTKLHPSGGIKGLYAIYGRGAKKRNYGFDLTFEQFGILTKQNCAYCGLEPSQVICYYIYNGIDRIDNSKGYTIDNVRPCCKICNYAKGTLTEREFLDWLQRIVKHNKREVD